MTTATFYWIFQIVLFLATFCSFAKLRSEFMVHT